MIASVYISGCLVSLKEHFKCEYSKIRNVPLLFKIKNKAYCLSSIVIQKWAFCLIMFKRNSCYNFLILAQIPKFGSSISKSSILTSNSIHYNRTKRFLLFYNHEETLLPFLWGVYAILNFKFNFLFRQPNHVWLFFLRYLSQ